MTKMNVRAAMRYQMDYMIKSSLWFAACVSFIALIITLIVTITSGGNVDFGFVLDFVNVDVTARLIWFDIGGIMVVTLFIVGIGGIREDLRFFIQNGIGRKTTYLSTLYTSLIIGAAAGLFSELINVIYNNLQAFPASGLRFAFAHNNFLLGWLASTVTYFFAWQFGTLWSLAYYRMSKIVKIIFTSAIIATVFFALPNSISYAINTLIPGSGDTPFAAIQNFLSVPGAIVIILFTKGVFCAAANFLLIRGAQIKET